MIFRDFAPKYHELGLSVMPVNGKIPIIKGYTEYADKLPDDSTIEEWCEHYPDKNISLILGKQCGVIVIDIDLLETDPDYKKLISVLPPYNCAKKGLKGINPFYRLDSDYDPWRLDPVVECLYTGRQTVIPPSVHPETGWNYIWIGEDLLTCLDDLNTITPEQLDTIYHVGLELKKPTIISNNTGTGRNTRLMQRATAAAFKGKPETQISKELLNSYDSSWFSDKSEPHKGKDPEEAASKMARRAIGYAEKKSDDLPDPIPIFDSFSDKDIQFPISHIPGIFGELCEDMADRIDVPVEFAVAPMITAICCAIGNNLHFRMREKDISYLQRNCLWSMIVARPGLTKTAPTNQIKSYLNRIDKDVITPQYKKDMVEYEDLKLKFDLEMKEYKKMYEKHVGKKLPRDEFEEIPPQHIVIPKKQILTTTGGSSEGIGLCMEQSNHTTIFQDELSDWIMGFTRYNASSDKTFYLMAYDGGRDNRMFKNARNTNIEDMYLNVYGTIQPDKVKLVFGGDNSINDGFFERFMFYYPPEIIEDKAIVDRKVNYRLKESFYSALLGLYEKEFFGNVGGVLTPTPDAFKLLYDYEKEFKRKSRDPKHSARLRQIYSKSRGLIGRLAIPLHAMSVINLGISDVDLVQEKVIDAAYSMISDYFVPCAMKMTGECERSEESVELFSFLRKMYEIGLENFTLADVRRMEGMKNAEKARKFLKLTEDYYFVHATNETVRGGGTVYKLRRNEVKKYLVQISNTLI